MTFEFKPAVKSSARLRLALFGPSGSGKTYTALRLAKGLGGKVAVIDTERGSASKYAGPFSFDVLELTTFSIDTYIEAIKAASGYDVLIIDSLTHAWHQLVDDVEKVARAKFAGNTWAAWSLGTPRQRSLVDALLGFSGHIIATMRVKTEWATGTDDRGKFKATRVGLDPQQGKGIEYEFDLLAELNPDHVLTVLKDRTGKFQDAIIDKPGEALGRDLAAWLMEGKAPVPKPAVVAAVAAQVVTQADPIDKPEPALAEVFPREEKAPAPKATNGKGSAVTAKGWKDAATALATRELYWWDEKRGEPSWYHLVGAAKKIGFTSIDEDNLELVIDALQTYANQEKATFQSAVGAEQAA